MYTYRWDRISHASLTRNKNTYHLGIHFRYRYLGSIRHTFRDWDVAFFAPSVRTHREIFFEILLNKSEIRLYLQYSDWFGSKRTSVWIQINRKMVNTIWFQVDLIRFRKYFSECRVSWHCFQTTDHAEGCWVRQFCSRGKQK